MFSGMPMSLRNSTSTRMTSWEARRHDLAAFYSKLLVLGALLLVQDQGETAVPYTMPLRQQQSTTYTWQRQYIVFLTCGNKINGSMSWLWPPFWPSKFLGKASILFLLRICLCQRHVVPGHHLRSANPPESKRTWPTYDGCGSQVEKIQTESFLDHSSAWNDTIQSVHGWCSRKQHSCGHLRAEWTTTNWNCQGLEKRRNSLAMWKGGSWRPVYALQSLYGPVFPSELSIAMKLVLMTIRTKGILIDLQYSDISSIRKRWLSRPNDSVVTFMNFGTTPVGIQASLQFNTQQKSMTKPLAVRSRHEDHVKRLDKCTSGASTGPNLMTSISQYDVEECIAVAHCGHHGLIIMKKMILFSSISYTKMIQDAIRRKTFPLGHSAVILHKHLHDASRIYKQPSMKQSNFKLKSVHFSGYFGIHFGIHGGFHGRFRVVSVSVYSRCPGIPCEEKRLDMWRSNFRRRHHRHHGGKTRYASFTSLTALKASRILKL